MSFLFLFLFLSLAAAPAHAAPPQPISDAEIARIAAAPFDKRDKEFDHDVLGIHNGLIVIADYPCGDVCPDYTVRIIHYDRPAGPECTAAGGVNAERMVPRGIAVTRQSFCVPRVIANRR